MSSRLRRTSLAALVVAAALAACNDDRTTPTGLPEDPAAAGAEMAARKSALPKQADQAQLERLARRVARALSDREFRSYVKDELKKSRVVEQKLQFQRFLDQPNRRALQALARANQESEAAILADARSAIDLEMYLPVPEHREAWQGDENLLVATAIGDRDAPVAYDVRGRRQVLSADQAPTTSVLAIVPQETYFDSYYYWLPGFDLWPGWSLEPAPVTPGLYVTNTWFRDDFEGWLKGKPEFEIHVLGQDGTSDALTSYQCVGEHAPSAYYWDQNSTSWSGSALVFTQQQIDTYRAQHPGQSLRILVVEDDDTACQIKVDGNRFLTMIKTIDAQYANLTGGKDNVSGLQKWWTRATAFQKILKTVWSWLTTQDELVGNAVEGTVAGLSYPGMNWVVKGESNRTNGWLNLIMK